MKTSSCDFLQRITRGGLFGVIVSAFAFTPLNTHAISVVNGSFEAGLIGWNTYGDVSVQGAGFGLDPTAGSSFAVLTTIDEIEPSVYGTPLSGNFAMAFNDPNQFAGLGLPVDVPAFVDAIYPQYSTNLPNAAPFPHTGSVLNQTIHVEAGSVISFDYNFLSDDYNSSTGHHGDFAVVAINGFDFFAPLDDHLLSPSNVDLSPASLLLTTGESGFHTFSYFASTEGYYTVAVGVFDSYDSSVMSALAIDNFTVTKVPEPATLLLMGGGLIGIFSMRRKFSPRKCRK